MGIQLETVQIEMAHVEKRETNVLRGFRDDEAGEGHAGVEEQGRSGFALVVLGVSSLKAGCGPGFFR